MAAKARALSLMGAVSGASCRCPAHGGGLSSHASYQATRCAGDSPNTDYAFEMACSNIRFGEGVTQEVGYDFANMKAKRLAVVTDKNISKLPVMKTVLDSLTKQNLNFDVFDDVTIEPTDVSFNKAISWAKQGSFDSYLAVGGGSVMDTCKVANLYASDPDQSKELLDYVNPPIGKGTPVTHTLHPLIAIPTTAGTGSETTGVAVFDLHDLKAKTGIGSRAIRPLLGIVDPLNVMTMPNRVAAYSAFDVFCHALESYTALPYNKRSPRPANPINRPAYQGSNPISDVWSKQALRMCSSFMIDSINSPDNFEARKQMCAASAFAGIGFGNAGVHLCHGLSYGISGNVKAYHANGYPTEKPLIPHGLSVVITAPAVFKWTAPACPERHLEAAQILGRDTSNDKLADAGVILADIIKDYCNKLEIDDGLKTLGYTSSDIPALVEATIPQERVTKLAPREKTREDLASILENSLTMY
ncbi:hydroxyacid-oxoacid transhydrogenase, mitochondrial-like [Watersipora subatra]|uniref:hydroxyacid-oxoacid transhydrogenase, mitochondrial-like n=1 Tax=Watersipora subatra TaxID=2589382 RepID=UPI00355C8D18